MAKKKSKKKLIIFLSIVGVVILLVIAKRAGLIGKEPLTKVEIEKPLERTIVEVISASGKIQPEVEVKIAPEVSGEVVELPVKEGQYVEKGQLLARIKPDTYVSMKERVEASLNSSKAQLTQVDAQLAQAQLTYDRQKLLFEQGVIAKSEFETAQTSLNQLKAQKRTAEFNIKSAEASLKEADENLYKTTIYAPNSGTISKLNVEIGERVVGTAQMAGTEILRLADLSRMEVRADVNENDIVRVELGDTALVDVDAYLGKKFKGIVSRIANSSSNASASADQVTNFEVRIHLLPDSYTDIEEEGKPSPFRPGMSASVDIQTNTKMALSIPIQAITTRLDVNGEKEEVVWIFKSDSSIVKRVPIKSGIQDKKHIEVSGLDSSMQVVVAPFSAVSKTLVEGQKVDR
ncbi:Macrolide-specific efflux protein MacA [Mucinivorans hirudinis]|uniref:Macrolide-specific efflux protein MacA n=1 Tax=Mucinivorans hirudinis TaxID=1433126 RepID=A0A060RB49_9BACT|nr:Macrolide-specific efflux protein MacA [Mucinivorans hirudinis]